jgi:hypothetical protein
VLNQLVQKSPALDQWQTPQILTIEPQQIESVEDGLALAGHQFAKLADVVVVETDNFAVKDRVLDRELDS